MTDEDAPLTLKEACELVFRNTVRPATLRAEAGRNRLTIFRIGKRDFTTLRNVREMICRAEQKAPASTWTESADSGLSETARISSARAAARITIEGLKRLSKPTSVKSTSRNRQPVR